MSLSPHFETVERKKSRLAILCVLIRCIKQHEANCLNVWRFFGLFSGMSFSTSVFFTFTLVVFISKGRDNFFFFKLEGHITMEPHEIKSQVLGKNT